MKLFGEAIVAATEGHHEWEIAIRRNDNQLVLSLFAPHRKNPDPDNAHKTRPYHGVTLDLPVDEAELSEALLGLRKHLERY